MRYQWTAVLLLGILVVPPVTLVRAEDSSSPAMEAQKHHKDGGKWQKKLGLTEDQSAKLKALRLSQKTALQPLREKQRDLTKKLKGQVKNKAADSDITATLDELKANRKAMMDQMEQFQSQKNAILTPTQRSQMLLGHMKHRHSKGHDKDGDKEDQDMHMEK